MAPDKEQSESEPPRRDQNDVSGSSRELDTGGGAYIEGNVSTGGAPFVGRDLIVQQAETAYDVRGLANPFLGLRSFTYEERGRYAGRAQTVEEAVRLITTPGAQRTLLFVTGVSGSGKSSFVQAGLLPALEQYYAQRNRTVGWAVMRPSRHPLAGLADALLRLGLPAEGFFAPAAPHVIGAPVTRAQPEQISLLVLDQAEELFTLSVPDQRDMLLKMLESLPAFADLRMHLIAALRVDYLPDLFVRRTLYDRSKEGIELRVMTVDELKAAIQQPVQQAYPRGEKRFEEALLETLARDAAGDATFLPLLQVTLEDLWRRGTLKLSAYDNLADAIGRWAEEVFHYATRESGQRVARLEAEQALVLRIFLDLVEVPLREEDHRDVRQRRTITVLTRGDVTRERLIEELVGQRLLSQSLEPSAAPNQEIEVVTIIHEALIANWQRLHSAVDSEREKLRLRGRFEYALREWENNERRDLYLLEGVRLNEAESLAQLHDIALEGQDAQELFKRSIERRERQRRWQKVGRSAIAVVLLLLLGTGVYLGVRETVRRTTGAPLVTMGSAPASTGNAAANTAMLSSFAMERFEATNAQYRACMTWGPCNSLLTMPEEGSMNNYPVVNITASQAQTYCRWLGRRLPTSVEWERAARGPHGHLWPWGDELLPAPSYTFPEKLLPVESESETATAEPEQLYHMADNVSEWVVRVPPDCRGAACHQTWDGETDVVASMGGAYDRSIEEIAQIDNYSPTVPDESRGFRCAADAEF